MQERDPRGSDPGARLLVDHPHPGVAQPGEGRVDVRHLVGDVVQARPALGQELADRRVLAGLRDAGVRMIDEQPRIGIRSSRVAFLHPSASGGVLTELVEPAEVHA